MKTIERAHTPNKLWEKVKLSKNYETAIKQISEELKYWPNFTVHKCKQRFTKITQYLTRMRKLKLKDAPRLNAVYRKVEKLDKKREAKALKAAKLEHNIEQKLLERLKAGTYGEIYNFNQDSFNKLLDEQELSEDEEELLREQEAELSNEVEFVVDSGDEDDDEEEDEEDDEEDDEDDGIDMEDFDKWASGFGEEDSDEEDSDSEDEEGMEGEAGFVDPTGGKDVEDDSDDDEDSDDEGGKKKKKKRKKPSSKSKSKPDKKKRKKTFVEVQYETEREPAQRLRN
eukprot:TRINITY_DN1809_c0_g2_i7.p1 TRINITY_DN1809_c0_g2~~TRINITY_DN1809_c0_g2_i7.p1  ORF type:complete len:284 (+),score=147.96 TRINITY_DN1809_c0_g2_i7:1046-1897(+)